MFDVAPTELILVGVVALVIIGPKELPRMMRTVGQWVGRARGVARHFRSGFDAMVREAELAEMEKKWREENEAIMRAYPPPPPVLEGGLAEAAVADIGGPQQDPELPLEPAPAANKPQPDLP